MSRPEFTDATHPAAPEPSWLSVPESEAWLPLAGLIRKLPAALDRQLQSDAGISHFEYVVLSRLSESPQRTLRMSELAEFANGSLSRLSHVVKRLEHRGWIHREPCPEDGRFTNAILTDDGHAKVVATAPGHVQTVRTLVVDALSPTQLRQLRAIVARIHQQIDSDTARPTGQNATPHPRPRR